MKAERLLVAAVMVVAVATGALAVGEVGGGDASAFTSRDWEVTSGDWVIDGDRASTDAPVFRARTSERDHGDVAVDLRFRIDDFEQGGGHEWDGVHVGVRYSSPDDLYYVSVARRDGTVTIKRKVGGEYETLASGRFDVAVDEWHRVRVAVRTTADDAVTITTSVDGEPVLEATDDDPAGLVHPGRVSLRSDEVAVAFADLDIQQL